jgi:hypothetical protein
MAQAAQILITLVYWAALHKNIDGILANEHESRRALTYFMLVWIHIYPLIAISVNVALSRFVFSYAHAKYVFWYGPPYMVVNYLGTVSRGGPLYPFMPWTDYKTVIIGLFLLIVECGFFYGTTFLVKTIKGKGAETKGSKHGPKQH